MTKKFIPLLVAALLAPAASFAQTADTTYSLATVGSGNPAIAGESDVLVSEYKKVKPGSDRSRCRKSKLVEGIMDSVAEEKKRRSKKRGSDRSRDRGWRHEE